MYEKFEVMRRGASDLEACVHSGLSDKEILEFAEIKAPGMPSGWRIRTAEEFPEGFYQRALCYDMPGFVHVVMDANSVRQRKKGKTYRWTGHTRKDT